MALRDRLPFNLPFGNDPAQADATQTPGDQLLGHTAQAAEPGKEPMPRAGAVPFGQSGRANFYGLPAPDELNQQLVGPQGLRRLNEMYRTDAHVRRLVLAAWAPIVAGTWTLEPYGGEDTTDADKQIADEIWWLLTKYMSPNFQEHLYQVGPLLLRSGFLPCEELWGTVSHGGRTLLAPRKLDLRLPSSVWRFWQDEFGELTHIGQILPNRADVVIPASELVYYRLGAEGDNWQGTSLLRHAWKHWYLKDKLERIDAIGQERKAVGVPVCYPPTGASPQVKAQMEALLANLHMSEVAFLMMPGPKAGSQGTNGVPNEEWLLDVIQFDSSSGESIHTSIDYHQTAIAASFLTDFLELGHHQVGARATAEVQEDPFLTAINGALLPPIVPPLNALIDRIRRLNWDSAEGSPTLKLTLHDEASLSEIAAYVAGLVTAGALQVDPELEDWLRDRGGLPAANADVRAQKQAASEAGAQAAQELAKTGELPGAEPPNPDEVPAAPATPGSQAQKTGKPPRSTATGKQEAKTLDAAPPPPNLRVSESSESDDPEHECGTCLMFDAEQGRCWGYGNFPTQEEWVCDSWALAPDATDQDAQADAARTLDEPGAPVAAGVIVQAQDTGRVLLVKRAADDADDPGVFGAYEFPGGKLDPADASAWQGALREFSEETGTGLQGIKALGSWRSPDGRYQAFLARVPAETDIQAGRSDRGEVAALAWRDPASLEHDTISQRAQALLPGLQQALSASKQLDAPSSEPTANWFEHLLSTDQLREAFDGARDHVQAACAPQALLLARQLAHQAANDTPITSAEPPTDLADALSGHYTDLYQLGQQTVGQELAKQRAALAKTLDDPLLPAAGAAQGSRLARARARGQHSARSILGAIQQRLGAQQITGLQDPAALQTIAEQAATAQLRVEALQNTAAMVNDGRYDAAMAAPDVVGGVYTSALDNASCQECESQDTGDVLSPEDAVALGPPNPDCAGGLNCRCTIIWVLSTDPAALQAVA